MIANASGDALPTVGCDTGLSPLGRTGWGEMETVIIMWRLEMTHGLLFLTAVFIFNLRKQRDGERK